MMADEMRQSMDDDKVDTLLYVPSIEEIRECAGNWLFSDGGVIYDGVNRPSRSTIGGPWAWVRVHDGKRVACASGVVPAPKGGSVTNNVTELYALAKGMATLPDGWKGTIVCDSKCTLWRRYPRSKMNGVPTRLEEFARHQFARFFDREGVRFVLVDGHPTPEQLETGIGKTGNRVSAWNHLCDTLCNEAKAEHLAAQEAA